MYFAIFTCGCLSTLNSLSIIFGNRERFLLQINSWMEDIHRASGPNDRPRVCRLFGCCKSLTSSLEGQFNTWLSKCLVIEIIALVNVRMPLKLLCILAFVSTSRWSNFMLLCKKPSTKFCQLILGGWSWSIFCFLFMFAMPPTHTTRFMMLLYLAKCFVLSMTKCFLWDVSFLSSALISF